MRVICFRYRGRIGHFMRAEMNASALSYPVPPRTSLLGLLAGILGLPKDVAPAELDGWATESPSEAWEDRQALIGVAGAVVPRHYHRANVRKRSGLTDALPLRIRPAAPGDSLPDVTGGGAATQVTQEWLLAPEFRIFVAIRNRKWMDDLCERFAGSTVRTHFTPCLGPAWMLATLEPEMIGDAVALPEGAHQIVTICRRSVVRLPKLQELSGLAVQEVRMPRTVTPDRIFKQENYLVEMNGQPLPVETSHAWSFGGQKVTFL